MLFLGHMFMVPFKQEFAFSCWFKGNVKLTH